MDTKGLNDSQIKMAVSMSKLYNSAKYWDILLGYFEYLLGFNYQSCPKGWIPSKQISISEKVRFAMIWTYNWYLQSDIKDRQVKVYAWVKMSQAPGFKASDRVSWKYLYIPDNTAVCRRLFASQALLKFILYSLVFPEQLNPASCMTVEQISDRLEELKYDYDQVEKDVSMNTGHIYTAIFDSQASDVMRLIMNRLDYESE